MAIIRTLTEPLVEEAPHGFTNDPDIASHLMGQYIMADLSGHEEAGSISTRTFTSSCGNPLCYLEHVVVDVVVNSCCDQQTIIRLDPSVVPHLAAALTHHCLAAGPEKLAEAIDALQTGSGYESGDPSLALGVPDLTTEEAADFEAMSIEPVEEAERVTEIKRVLLNSFSGIFSADLPQALYDIAHGRP